MTAVIAVPMGSATAHDRLPPIELAEANDNRSPAGTLAGGMLELRMETRPAAWRPDAARPPVRDRRGDGRRRADPGEVLLRQPVRVR
jgi:hypothetical protein